MNRRQRPPAPRFAAFDQIFSGNGFARDTGPSGAFVTLIDTIYRLLKTATVFCAATFEVHKSVGSGQWAVGSLSTILLTAHCPLPIEFYACCCITASSI